MLLPNILYSFVLFLLLAVVKQQRSNSRGQTTEVKQQKSMAEMGEGDVIREEELKERKEIRKPINRNYSDDKCHRSAVPKECDAWMSSHRWTSAVYVSRKDTVEDHL